MSLKKFIAYGKWLVIQLGLCLSAAYPTSECTRLISISALDKNVVDIAIFPHIHLRLNLLTNLIYRSPVVFRFLFVSKFDYQPPGSTDSVILTPADLDCLSPGAQINDAIINFYLKYLYFEQLSDLQRACAYVFNCFFYSRLAASAQTVPPANTRSQHTKPASDSVSSLPS